MTRSAARPPSRRLVSLHRSLLRWYRAHARPFPWRRTRDPYRVLVSEVMLQQTQASRVEAKYPEFIRRFPTLRRLAAARTSEVVRAWQGMGYNRRAVNLHRMAKEVVERFDGHIPSTAPLLLSLPGLGPYTAHALACFAFGAPVATVDTNIRRVLTRLFPSEARRMDIWQLAEHALPQSSAYDWNQGLMELGARICRARDPICSECPLVVYCPSAHHAAHIKKRRLPEAGRNGVPNRIFRGRIVEVLRRSRSALTIEFLARRAVPDLKRNEMTWIRDLVLNLQRDGIVKTVRRSEKTFVGLAE